MPNQITILKTNVTIAAVSRDKFIISGPDYLGDVMLSKHGEFKFFPSPKALPLTEAMLTRITRLVRRQNRILNTLNQLKPKQP